MIYKEIQGDLFQENTYYVQCLSADIVAGAGIAVQFNNRFGINEKRITLQIGSEAGHQMNIFIETMDTSELGLYHVDLRTSQGATEAIDIIENALIKVSAQRTKLGAYQNRLEHTIQNLENVVENTTASESQIRDSDMAKLMVEYSNNQILLQAGQVIMAQANRSKELVLGLLQM